VGAQDHRFRLGEIAAEAHAVQERAVVFKSAWLTTLTPAYSETV
jgi:hypothetical protein